MQNPFLRCLFIRIFKNSAYHVQKITNPYFLFRMWIIDVLIYRNELNEIHGLQYVPIGTALTSRFAMKQRTRVIAGLKNP
jgi:hypothetical protein